MEQRIKTYMSSLSEEGRLLCIKKQISSSLNLLKKRNKASISEFNHKGDRGGRCNSKNQTLYSNSYNTARLYDSSIEDLKKFIKHL